MRRYDDTWPRIQTDVDDDRPAREDEVGYCEGCGNPFLKDELREHAGEDRCSDCRPYCPVCQDGPVFSVGEFCEVCAMWAMGIEV